MPDTPPTSFDRTAALRIAQQLAFENAHSAQEHHDQAAERTRYANDRAGKDFMRQAVTEARQSAQLHRDRATEHAHLADTWAHVTTALATVTDGQPAAYELSIQLDPKDVGAQLLRQISAQRRPESG
ncbi:hypothetical protein ACFW91_24980 [Streptomyces asoensis]|uniref:hypothetical protein n=1 Tax=Streptomyces asoensis TaxID=249586 RepID=UPI0036B0148F